MYAHPSFESAQASGLSVIAAPGDEMMLKRSDTAYPPAAVLVDDRTAVADALVAGAGAGILPAFLGEPARAAGRLIRFREQPLATFDIHAVYLATQRSDPRLRTLIDLIDSELKRTLAVP
jgi:DNA-binding transcriptional LysR family regulator